MIKKSKGALAFQYQDLYLSLSCTCKLGEFLHLVLDSCSFKKR